MSDFHFLRPLWLLALLPLGVLLWRLTKARGGGGDWMGVCDPHLLAQLQIKGSGSATRRLLGLLGLGWTLAVLALAGPAWQQRPVPVFQSVTARVIVLDLSHSMAATDLAPSRLVRARYKIKDILARSGEGQVGLVVYAGAAFTVAPLTQDGATVAALLESLDPAIMPSPGSRTDRGLEQAAQLLERAGRRRGEILLVADQAEPTAVTTARQLRESGFTVSVLGVGTPQGAPIPLPRGGYLQDADGNIVIPRLEEDRLQELAAAGGGRYARLSASGADLAVLLSPIPADPEAQRVDRNAERWYEEGVWLLPLLLPLGALAFRRGWLLAVPIMILLSPPPVRAQDWSVLWLNQEQRAAAALARGELQRALELSDDPLRQGTAAYRAGNFEAAAAAFARVSGAEGHYNRGNALAQQGRFAEAIAA
ncbi:MAG: VWA domain-containing protein, partial [Candidatus Competibacteraceae bacterium]|nr:VWA domain-containing protein [Candidatus Competibacteraceae bacterium]